MIAEVPDRPVSFEVFADEFAEMRREALEIASWGDNVYVKIPVTNTRRKSSVNLIRELAGSGVKLNVTALLTVEQVREVAPALDGGPGGFISVFAGRIADTGRDPIPIMTSALELLRSSQESGAHLGQSERDPEHLPRRRHRVSHHNGDKRSAQESRPDRQRSRRLFAGDGEDVS